MELITRLSPTRSRLIAYMGFLLIFLVAYLDSVTILFNLWAGIEDTIYRYGFLLLACTCYLLYLKRLQLLEYRTNPNGWALLPSLLLVAVWFVASLVGVQTVQLAVLPFLILALTTALFGLSFLRLAGLPILLLIFAIPLWWPLLPFLKDATTLITELFLKAISKPVFVEGYFLHLPGGSFFVDDGCAGLRFLLVTLILGFMSIDMYGLSLKRGAILVATAVLLALVANWIRVIVVVLVGDYTRMEHRLVADHNDLGWVIYGIVVLLPFFFMVGKLTATTELRAAQVPEQTAAATDPRSQRLIYVLAFLILVSAPLLSAMVRFQEYPERIVSLPQSTQGWELSPNDSPQWQANYSGASQYLFGRYQSGIGSIGLHLVNYASQEEGVELINVDNTLTDEDIWRVLPGTESQRSVDIDGLGEVDVLTAELESESGQHKLLWYWFDVGGRHSADTFSAKVYELLALLNGRKDANLIAVSADCRFNCNPAVDLLSGFIGDMYANIEDSL